MRMWVEEIGRTQDLQGDDGVWCIVDGRAYEGGWIVGRFESTRGGFRLCIHKAECPTLGAAVAALRLFDARASRAFTG